MAVKSLLKSEVKAWLDKSAKSELYASNMYKHLSNQCQRLGYFGAQKFFLNESKDEIEHYEKLVNYTNDMGDILVMPSLPAINESVKTIGDCLDVAYEIELELMKQYQKFYEEAEDKYEDCITATFIIEFLQIQRKSVGEYGDLISRYEKNKDDVFEFDEMMEDLVK